MDIKSFKDKFDTKLNGYTNKWGRDQRALHLMEEVGEFAEILLQFKGDKEPKKEIGDVKVALADVLEDVLALASLYNIELEDLFSEVIKADE